MARSREYASGRGTGGGSVSDTLDAERWSVKTDAVVSRAHGSANVPLASADPSRSQVLFARGLRKSVRPKNPATLRLPYVRRGRVPVPVVGTLGTGAAAAFDEDQGVSDGVDSFQSRTVSSDASDDIVDAANASFTRQS